LNYYDFWRDLINPLVYICKSTLPEVHNYSQHKYSDGYSVNKDKGTSVHFDREKCSFVGLTEIDIKNLKDSYPGVNVEAEMKKMGFWLKSSKGIKLQGNLGFIMNWLNKATPQANIPHSQVEIPVQQSPLRPLIDLYNKELWKGREHILAMNKKS
jgi:hypothetical protein